MAGLISVNGQKTWSAANWVFDHILKVLRTHLPEEGSARILKLIDSIVPGLNSLSLENLTPEEMRIFRKALESAYHEVVTSGADAFGDPDFYPGFIKRFQELLEMIPRD